LKTHFYKEPTMNAASRFAALCLTALTLATGTLPALAHDDATLDAMKSANGGQLRMSGIYHFELVVNKDSKVAKENPVQVYVTDHAGKKLDTTGASGTVTILAAKQKTIVTLKPDGSNRLKGVTSYASTPDMKAIVSITLPGMPPEQARFTPMTAMPAQPMAHQH
jgi:hypothetical protein